MIDDNFVFLKFKNKKKLIEFDKFRMELFKKNKNFEFKGVVNSPKRKNQINICYTDRYVIGSYKNVSFLEVSFFDEYSSVFIDNKKLINFYILIKIFDRIYIWVEKNYDFFEEKYNLKNFENYIFEIKNLLKAIFNNSSNREKIFNFLNTDEFNLFIELIFNDYYLNSKNHDVRRKEYFSQILSTKILFDITGENFIDHIFKNVKSIKNDKEIISLKTIWKVSDSLPISSSIHERSWRLIEDFVFYYLNILFFGKNKKKITNCKNIISNLYNDIKTLTFEPNIVLMNWSNFFNKQLEKKHNIDFNNYYLISCFNNVNKILYKSLIGDSFYCHNTNLYNYVKNTKFSDLFENNLLFFLFDDTNAKYRDFYYFSYFNKIEIRKKDNFYIFIKKDNGSFLYFSLVPNISYYVSKNNIIFIDLLKEYTENDYYRENNQSLFCTSSSFYKDGSTKELANIFSDEKITINPFYCNIDDIKNISKNKKYIQTIFDLQNVTEKNKIIINNIFNYINILSNSNKIIILKNVPFFLVKNSRIMKFINCRKISNIILNIASLEDAETFLYIFDMYCNKYYNFIYKNRSQYISKIDCYNSMKFILIPLLNCQNLKYKISYKIIKFFILKQINIILQNIKKSHIVSFSFLDDNKEISNSHNKNSFFKITINKSRIILHCDENLDCTEDYKIAREYFNSKNILNNIYFE